MLSSLVKPTGVHAARFYPSLELQRIVGHQNEVMWAQEHLLLLQSLHEQFSNKKKPFLQMVQLREQDGEGFPWDVKT